MYSNENKTQIILPPGIRFPINYTTSTTTASETVDELDKEKRITQADMSATDVTQETDLPPILAMERKLYDITTQTQGFLITYIDNKLKPIEKKQDTIEEQFKEKIDEKRYTTTTILAIAGVVVAIILTIVVILQDKFNEINILTTKTAVIEQKIESMNNNNKIEEQFSQIKERIFFIENNK